ncbi:MAG: MBL fold metallo-hydrolase, partial [Opitutae bacterium]|nr:MBL fold metallo-hydrolase [Opitutae bacterium]
MGRFESVDVLKNTTVVNLKNESIIIDPGAETAFMAIGKNIRCVLLTHAHFDHVNGL